MYCAYIQIIHITYRNNVQRYSQQPDYKLSKHVHVNIIMTNCTKKQTKSYKWAATHSLLFACLQIHPTVRQKFCWSIGTISVGCNGSSTFFSPSICNNNHHHHHHHHTIILYILQDRTYWKHVFPGTGFFLLSVHLPTVQRTCVLNAVLSSVVGDDVVAGACCGCGGFSTFTCIKTATVTSRQKTTLRFAFTNGLPTNVPAEQTALKQFIYPASSRWQNCKLQLEQLSLV